ncbi:amino acid transporter, partial [Protomyces lactucae-debilis]
QARVLSEHLDPAFSAELVHNEGASGTAATGSEEPVSSLKLLGGDMHRDLYKIDARAKLHHRAATFSHPTGGLSTDERFGLQRTTRQAHAPGAFRREFINHQQRRISSFTGPVTNNFIDFLDLYGQFAGEDLAESDNDESVSTDDDHLTPAHEVTDESRPLLGRRKSSRVPKKGDASIVKTFFLLVKSFIGTGVLFLPKAFSNGGILFSSIALLAVSLVSCLAFHLLLECRKHHGGGYGEIGQAIGGDHMRTIILISITVSQIGFVCAGMIFVAENMSSFLAAVGKTSDSPLSVSALLALQLAVLVPLALIRNIAKLGSSALLADVCILIGLTYIWYYDIATLLSSGAHHSVRLFNAHNFPLTVGSAIFTFEGIGLLLPIQSSMARPQHFERLLYLVMLLITLLFLSVGALSYATFGEHTRTEIITNYPQTSKLVNAVQFLYSLAVLVGTPVQLFPAMRILEGGLFGHLSGKRDILTKWKKNSFRLCMVLACGLLALLGANDLDKFVALIGSFACVPLVYIYPALLHLKSVASSRFVQAVDILLICTGIVAMVFTTSVTVIRWAE